MSDEVDTPEDEDDGWIEVDVPDVEAGGAFRFREGEDGELEVEIGVNDPEDQASVEWYARGYLDCYEQITADLAAGALGQMFEGGDEDEEPSSDAAAGEVN